MSLFAVADKGNEAQSKIVTNADFDLFFAHYVKALNDGDSNAISSVIDMEEVFSRILESNQGDEAYKKGVEEFRRYQFKENLVKSLVSTKDNAFEAKLLKVTKMSKNSAEGLVRIITAEDKFKYVKLYAKKIYVERMGEQIVIVERFDYGTGTNFVNVLSGLIEFSSLRSGFVGRVKDTFSGKDKYREMLMEYGRIKTTGDVRKYRQFFEQYQSLMKDNWVALNLAIQLSIRIQEQGFEFEVLKFMDEHYGMDKRAGILLLNYHFVTEQFDKAIAVLNRYEKEFGVQDGLILSKKSMAFSQLGDTAQALKTSEMCLQVEPDFESCYGTAISLSLDNNVHSSTIKYINAAIENLGYEFTHESLSAEPIYADFIKSEEYANWDYIQKTK